MEENNKTPKKRSIEELKKFIEGKNRKRLEEQIFRLTDKQTKLSNTEISRRNKEKKLLLNSDNDIWKIPVINSTIKKIPSEYAVIFTQEYYKEIFRLNNWKFEENISNKPWIVGRFTNQIIYYRFSREILPILRLINPYIRRTNNRNFKHHQLLTESGREELRTYISQATKEMKKYNSWDAFRKGYCQKYCVPYQLKMFGQK